MLDLYMMYRPRTVVVIDTNVSHSVIIHIVSQCHEEGLEHYLRSFVKVNTVIIVALLIHSLVLYIMFIYVRFIKLLCCMKGLIY